MSPVLQSIVYSICARSALHGRGDRKWSRFDPVVVHFKLQTKFLIGHP